MSVDQIVAVENAIEHLLFLVVGIAVSIFFGLACIGFFDER